MARFSDGDPSLFFLGKITFAPLADRLGQQIFYLSVDRPEIILCPDGQFFPERVGEAEQQLFLVFLF